MFRRLLRFRNLRVAQGRTSLVVRSFLVGPNLSSWCLSITTSMKCHHGQWWKTLCIVPSPFGTGDSATSILLPLSKAHSSICNWYVNLLMTSRMFIETLNFYFCSWTKSFAMFEAKPLWWRSESWITTSRSTTILPLIVISHRWRSRLSVNNMQMIAWTTRSLYLGSTRSLTTAK